MKNNIYIPILVFFIALICTGVTCREDMIEYKYNFVEKVDLFPTQKSYQVGDTIWIEYVNQNNMLFDNLTGNHIEADTVSIYFQISFNRRYNAPADPPEGFCDFITSSGVNNGRFLSIYGTGFTYTIGCNSSNNYNFLVGVVPKHTGIYSLDLSDPRPISACADRVSPFPHSGIEYRFNTVDGNKDIYLSIPPDWRNSTDKNAITDKIDRKQVYVVKVE